MNYKGGDIDIGLGDFNHSKKNSRLKTSNNCVALTNKGLYINQNNLNKNIIMKMEKYMILLLIFQEKNLF